MSNRNFVQNNTPIPQGQFQRPSGGGRGSGSFPTGGTPNTALNMTTGQAGQIPRTVRNVPRANIGTPSNNGAAFLAQTNTLGTQGTGAGGESQHALSNMQRFMPNAPTPARMSHATPSFNGHDRSRSEQGVPAFANFGAKVQPFTRNIGPTSKSMNGLLFNGFDARPTKLDSTPGMGGSAGNGDPRTPNSLFVDGTQTQTSPFMMDAFTSARQAPESKHTGEGDIVNVTIPYAHVLRPFHRDPHLQPREYNGMPMIAFRGVEAVASQNFALAAPYDSIRAQGEPGYGLKQIARTDAARARHTELSLPLLNMTLASTEDNPLDAEGDLPDDYDEERNLMRFCDQWSVTGIGINDYGGKKRRRNGVPARGGESGYERAVNICVAGETTSLNPWGEKAGDGENRNYFIVKRVSRKDLSKLVGDRFNIFDTSLTVPPAGDATYRVTPESGINSVDGDGLHPSPYQLVPYSHRGSQPIPDDVLEYTTGLAGDNNVYRGVAILVCHTHYPLDTLRPQYSTNTQLDAVTGGVTRTLMPQATRLVPGDSRDAIESAKRQYRKLQMLQNLSIANDAQALINAGQLRVFVNIQTETEF